METTDYQKQATDFLNATGTTLSIEYSRYGKHFNNDKDERDIYKCVLQRGSRKYEFEFGNSILKSGKVLAGNKKYPKRFESSVKARQVGMYPGDFWTNPDFAAPTAYDILSCLQKYDVGSFDDFVSEFGYEFTTQAEYKQTLATYNEVLKEVNAVKMLFTDAEIEVLQDIN